MSKEKRFLKVWTDGAFGNNEILVDRETGVNYLYHSGGYGGGFSDNYMAIYVDKKTGVNYLFSQYGHGGGLCVLVDRDGKPIVTPMEE